MATGSERLQEEINNIPLADEDSQAVLSDDSEPGSLSEDLSTTHGRSIESIPSAYTNGSNSPIHTTFCLAEDSVYSFLLDRGTSIADFDPDMSADEAEEKARLIAQVLELQNTLDDLSQRVDSVKEENLKLRSENQVLGQYIENLMSASSVFQSTSPKSKKKAAKGKK